MNNLQKSLILISGLLALSFIQPIPKITIWMMGDSTMAIKEKRAYPETGWGMPFAIFFDSTIQIENRAKNGRSTKTFIGEKLWQNINENMKEGDYLFIQFGHNDESKEKTDRYTTPEEYAANIVMFINVAKQKKVTPILLTPVSRRYFDAQGILKETHPVYSNVVRSIAISENVILIDADKLSSQLLQQFGDENSKLLFMHLDSLEHPNYPNGRKDNTHFNELGARKIAELVLSEIKIKVPNLAQHIVVSTIK
jgi:lysophospholipase L1-like esterase